MLHLNDRCFYSCFSDNTRPAMPKTSLDFVFFHRQSQSEEAVLSWLPFTCLQSQAAFYCFRCFILANLLGNERPWFVICDWWISIRFVCFCVSRFVALFLKSTVSFTLVLSFFNLFILKRGKFRFQR